jgi:hypothetical protein
MAAVRSVYTDEIVETRKNLSRRLEPYGLLTVSVTDALLYMLLMELRGTELRAGRERRRTRPAFFIDARLPGGKAADEGEAARSKRGLPP